MSSQIKEIKVFFLSMYPNNVLFLDAKKIHFRVKDIYRTKKGHLSKSFEYEEYLLGLKDDTRLR